MKNTRPILPFQSGDMGITFIDSCAIKKYTQLSLCLNVNWPFMVDFRLPEMVIPRKSIWLALVLWTQKETTTIWIKVNSALIVGAIQFLSGLPDKSQLYFLIPRNYFYQLSLCSRMHALVVVLLFCACAAVNGAGWYADYIFNSVRNWLNYFFKKATDLERWIWWCIP